jgi:hypothetical protein
MDLQDAKTRSLVDKLLRTMEDVAERLEAGGRTVDGISKKDAALLLRRAANEAVLRIKL